MNQNNRMYTPEKKYKTIKTSTENSAETLDNNHLHAVHFGAEGENAEQGDDRISSQRVNAIPRGLTTIS